MELEPILSRALAPDPEHRYATAEEFRADLAGFRRELTETIPMDQRLSELLERHFGERRAERRRLVEARVARHNSIPPDGESRISLPGGVSLHDDHAATVRIGPPPTRQGRRRRRLNVALGAAGTLGLLALGAYLMAGARLEVAVARPTPEPAPEASSDANAATSAAPAATEQLAVAGGIAERCGAVHQAKGEKPIIDDFNRVDLVIDGYDGRIGKWYTYHDGSALPPTVKLDSFGLTRGMHVTGGPFTVWGAGVGADLKEECPYDASVYRGLRFVARGKSPVWLKVLTDQNIKPPLGVCPSEEERCHDAYQRKVELDANRWQVIDVAWKDLEQRGFGRKFHFDPARIIHVQFEWHEKIAFDVWVDHLGFYR